MVMPPQAGGLSAKAIQDAARGNSISPAELQQLGSANSDAPVQTATAAGGANFENMLGGFVNDVAQQQAAAHSTVNGLLGGQNVSLHQAMISMEEANVSFQMMVEVRNRLMDGYQELMRMQI
ncbi:MAG TPA: flagellar hook-basal body complex protein FliE [Verrucomicrobiae bacterium]